MKTLKEIESEGERMNIMCLKWQTKTLAEGLHKRLLRNFGGQRLHPAMD